MALANIMTLPERSLVFLIVLIFLVLLIDCVGEFLNLLWAQQPFFDIAKILLPFFLLIAHSAYLISLKRSLALIIFFCFVGFIAESIGLKSGILFGSKYIYVAGSSLVFSKITLFDQRLYLYGVPILVILYWPIFVYAGYSISNSFLFWHNRQKPSYKTKDIKLLVKIIVLDILIVLAIDFALDPVLVHFGNWKWINPGVYFGIPVGNFLGWAIVTSFLTGSFRIFEYNFPSGIKITNPLFSLFPIICLLILFLLVIGVSVREGLYLLIPVVVATMLPIIMANFYSFFVWGQSSCEKFNFSVESAI